MPIFAIIMSRAKEKRERALGVALNLKGERCGSPKCALVRKPYPPGMHGKKRVRKGASEFKLQLKEKQKFKLSYGLDERNLKRLFRQAAKSRESTPEKMLELLERRLDNVVFRLGLAPSRAAARQLVVQGHITVNGATVRSPGFLVRAGEVVGVKQASVPMAKISTRREILKNYEPPAWLELNKEGLTGKVVSLPKEISQPFEINLLVEAFSK